MRSGERQYRGALKVNNVRELLRCSVLSQQPGNTISRICGWRCIAEGFDRADLRKPEGERSNFLAAVSRRSGKLGRQCRERIVRDLRLACSRDIREQEFRAQFTAQESRQVAFVVCHEQMAPVYVRLPIQRRGPIASLSCNYAFAVKMHSIGLARF